MAQPELDRLIISNLADLDAAVQYVNDELAPPVAETMDKIVAHFLRDTGWAGVAKWIDKGVWFAPEDWRRQGNSHGHCV
jgi:hypothetical protein